MILIKGSKAVDPKTGAERIADVLIKDGKIAKIAGHIESEGEMTVIRAAGLTLAPGLIDVHVHFRDPGLTYKEDIQTGPAAAKRGG